VVQLPGYHVDLASFQCAAGSFGTAFTVFLYSIAAYPPPYPSVMNAHFLYLNLRNIFPLMDNYFTQMKSSHTPCRTSVDFHEGFHSTLLFGKQAQNLLKYS